MAEQKKVVVKVDAAVKKPVAKKVATTSKKEVAPKAVKVKAQESAIIQPKVSKNPKAPKVAKAKKPGMNYITVQQIASGAGRMKNQVLTLRGLGFGKVKKVVEVEDTPSVRGMIKTVQHLVKIIG